MITVEKLSYGFPDKDLYNEISFTLEEGQHAVLVGSNGTGKTTLIRLLMNPEDFLYDGKIIKEDPLKIGYVSQFVSHDKENGQTVFDFLCEDFLQMMKEQDELCAEMEHAEDMDEVYARYQKCLDEFAAVDGYNYETNIHRELKVAGLKQLEQVAVSAVSGGEFKLIQIIRQMLACPQLLIMDEPDVFLDFENLDGLKELINSYEGTLLAVTHNRFLLNHCFRKVLHLEGCELHEFDGSWMEYDLNLLRMKIEMQEAVEKESSWIEIQEKLVEKLRAEATRITNPAKGRLLKGRATYLERLKATRTREPFTDLRIPKITLPDIMQQESENTGFSLPEAANPKIVSVETEPAESCAEVDTALPASALLSLSDYRITFGEPLLESVSFTIGPHDKAALVGPNGTGKTTMLRSISMQAFGKKEADPAITIAPEARPAFLSQLYTDTLDEENTLLEEGEKMGFETNAQTAAWLADYCFEEQSLKKQIRVLSGGEKNLLQLAEIGRSDANLLLLDEPTSHLDLWSQMALEKAIASYRGAVLMVSHDFYSIADSADYVLYVEDRTVRKMSIRAFRKMVYKNHFDRDYLELEQKKKELETKAQTLLSSKKYKEARTVCDSLEEVLMKMH